MDGKSFGYVRLGLGNPSLRKADLVYNGDSILSCIESAKKERVGLLVLPPLCITTQHCGSLLDHSVLLQTQEDIFLDIQKALPQDMMVVMTAYEKCGDKVKEKVYLVTANERSDLKDKLSEGTSFCDFAFIDYPESFTDLYDDDLSTIVVPPIAIQAIKSEPRIGERRYLEMRAISYSRTHRCTFVGISTSGTRVVAENGEILATVASFSAPIKPWEGEAMARIPGRPHKARDNELLVVDCDLQISPSYKPLSLDIDREYDSLRLPRIAPQFVRRVYPQDPFATSNLFNLEESCYEILEIQAHSLAKRMLITNSQKVVLGISGGLDSTLALLATTRCFDLLELPHSNIITVTMPGFGTTSGTKTNAHTMMRCLNTDIREISIVESVTQHFKDIGHPFDQYDTTFENAQARERTQILMDIANMEGGLVVGTGDLSESALGWSTFNGDHMSMFGINGGIPKTMISHVIRYYINQFGQEDLELALALQAVLETPISPELLPADETGKIKQKTEEELGPYEIHDFFIYYFVGYGFEPSKLLFLAKRAFKDKYSDVMIERCLELFIKRFFSQQFKRNAAPDTVQVGRIDLSHARWKQDSEVMPRVWLNSLDY